LLLLCVFSDMSYYAVVLGVDAGLLLVNAL
jgi:hypothetical protein